jgi:hypothetical protein
MMHIKLDTRQWILATVLVLAAVLAVTPLLDRKAEQHYESLFQRALVTFALARTLNGVISAVQGTELALQPAGVGVTLTPGEILDPVNDLVERFSWIMLGATVSLGIQQVLLDVSAWWLVQGLVVLLAGWLLFAMVSGREQSDSKKAFMVRLLLVALFLRFAVPLTLIANDALYQVFLETRYEDSTQVIASAGEEIQALGERELPSVPEEEGGIFESLGRAWNSTTEGMNLGEKVDLIQARAAEMIEHLIQLSVVFILQTGLLPIIFLWLFLQLAKQLFRPLQKNKN